jgi:hypothetical protein
VVSLVLCVPNDGLSGGNDMAAALRSKASLHCVDNEISTWRGGAGNTKPLLSSVQIAVLGLKKRDVVNMKGLLGRHRRKWENIKLM